MTALDTNQPGPIACEALRWLRIRELESRETPTLRSVSLVVAPAAPETEVHRAVIDLLQSGRVTFAELHTGRVTYVHLTASGRSLADRLIHKAGLRVDPVKKRDCMNCQRSFVSTWIGHRLCDHCKATDAYRSYDLAPLHV